jgi:hypothetical protein
MVALRRGEKAPKGKSDMQILQWSHHAFSTPDPDHKDKFLT